MRFKVFAVFDDKAKAFLPPFVFPETGMAVRVFRDCVNDPNHQFGKHSEDYTLFRVGDFDTDNGTLIPYVKGIELVHQGLALKEVQS